MKMITSIYATLEGLGSFFMALISAFSYDIEKHNG